MKIVPTTFRAASGFIKRFHRHHSPPQGTKFCIGLESEAGELIGVAVVGRPVSRHLDDGKTAELTRSCVSKEPLLAPPGKNSSGLHRLGFALEVAATLRSRRNAESKLAAACWRVARAMGYERLLTYTLPSESGASLRGAGWTLVGEAGGGNWDKPGRKRTPSPEHLRIKKLRWETGVSDKKPAPPKQPQENTPS